MCNGSVSRGLFFFFLSFSLDGTTTGNSSTRRQVEWHVRMQPPNSSIPDEFWRVEREKEIGLPVENWLDNNNNNRRRRRGRITHLSLSLSSKTKDVPLHFLDWDFNSTAAEFRLETITKNRILLKLSRTIEGVSCHTCENPTRTHNIQNGWSNSFHSFNQESFSRVYPIRFLWFFYKRENAQHFVRQESLATAKRKKLQTFLFFFPILTTRFE